MESEWGGGGGLGFHNGPFDGFIGLGELGSHGMTAAMAQMRRRHDIVSGHESLRFSLLVGMERSPTWAGNRKATGVMFIGNGDMEVLGGMSTPRERGRRRCSSPRLVLPGSQIPNRYPGQAPDGLATRLCWWTPIHQLVSFILFGFLFFSFSVFCFEFPIWFANLFCRDFWI
jgi:hypothetical protein